MKKIILFLVLIAPVIFANSQNISKTELKYYIKLVPKGDTCCFFPNYNYEFTVKVDGYSGNNPPIDFIARNVDGSFEDGSRYKSAGVYPSFKVKWNESSYLLTPSVSILGICSDITNYNLTNGRLSIDKPIASLKNQYPFLPPTVDIPMGCYETIIIMGCGPMYYPNVFTIENNISVPKKVKNIEFTLPNKWVAEYPDGTNKTNTFTANIDDIFYIKPDPFTGGELKVRAVNEIGTAYSETTIRAFTKRIMAITNYPTSITYGSTTPCTFTATSYPNIRYEWSAPIDWSINGQGNTLEGLGLNSVKIIPNFCTYNKGDVKVRLKIDDKVSEWYNCPEQYKGVIEPTITIDTQPVYQYEKATFSLKNIYLPGIESYSITGDNVIYNANESTYQVTFFKSGLINLNCSVIMKGCSTPFAKSITVNVSPSRIVLNGPVQTCDQATLQLGMVPSGATIAWSTSMPLNFKLSSGQSTSSAVFYNATPDLANYLVNVYADITISGRTIRKTKLIQVGTPTPTITIFDLSSGAVITGNTLHTGVNYNFVITNPYSDIDNDYRWKITPPNIQGEEPQYIKLANGQHTYYTGMIPGNYTISLKNNGICGWSNETIRTMNMTGQIISSSFVVNTNQTSKILTITNTSFENNTEKNTLFSKSANSLEPVTIQIWNERLGLIRTIECKESKLQISTQNLAKGLYFVHIIRNKKIIQKEKIMIQ